MNLAKLIKNYLLYSLFFLYLLTPIISILSFSYYSKTYISSWFEAIGILEKNFLSDKYIFKGLYEKYYSDN